MPDNTWKNYQDKTMGRPPKPLLVRAMKLVANKDNALDLGSGAMNDVRYLLAEGFQHVTAVDSTPASEDLLKGIPTEKFSYAISSFEDFTFPENEYDLVNAQFSLPFNRPETFKLVLKRISDSLNKDAIFTGQFFGVHDEWNVPERKMTFHTLEQAKEQLSGFEVLEFQEKENDGPTALGKMKHWHVFHFIVRK